MLVFKFVRYKVDLFIIQHQGCKSKLKIESLCATSQKNNTKKHGKAKNFYLLPILPGIMSRRIRKCVTVVLFVCLYCLHLLF